MLVSVLALAAIAAALFFYLRARKLRKEVKRLQPRKYPKVWFRVPPCRTLQRRKESMVR